MTQPKFYFNHLKLKYFLKTIKKKKKKKKKKKMNVSCGRIRMDTACPPSKNAMPPQRMKRKAPAMNLCS